MPAGRVARTAFIGVVVVLSGLVLFAPRVAALPATSLLQLQSQEDASVCRARIDLVRWDLNAIYGAGGLGGDRPVETYAALITRLSAARARMDEGRRREAIGRLEEFETMVLALRDGVPPRVSPADAKLLIFGDHDSSIDEGVNGAIICVWLMAPQ